MKKICVVTWYVSLNYGTCLQCYALQKYLTNMGFECYTPDTLKYYYGFKHPKETFNVIKRKSFEKFMMKHKSNYDNRLEESYKIRIKKNNDFVEKNDNIYHVRTKKSLDKMIQETDVFMTGSDQIWNPEFVSPVYLLSFVPEYKKRIAYASSIGVDKIPDRKKLFYYKYLSKFNTIGVREKTARQELMKLNINNVYTVIDPTFLLDQKAWELVSERPNVGSNGPFIFCYFIGEHNTIWIDTLNFINKERKYKIYIALSESRNIPNVGTVLPELGVSEFLWMISNSSYILTDSFHAIALAINFNKDFYAFSRFSDENVYSQNSRIKDLLKEFELDERLLKNVIRNTSSINYTHVNHILRLRKKEAYEFIENACR